jgi:hypothetical protein
MIRNPDAGIVGNFIQRLSKATAKPWLSSFVLRKTLGWDETEKEKKRQS